MMHVPHETIELIGTDRIADAIAHNAHETFSVDGDDLNKLAILRLRLGVELPMTQDERALWISLLAIIVLDAQKSNPSAVIR